MTHSNYTRENLKNFSRGQLHEACDRLLLPRRRSKEDCITDILATQPQVIAQAELDAHIEEQAQAEVAVQQRLEMNQLGYRDAVEGLASQSADPCYRMGYERGIRDITPSKKEDLGSQAIAFVYVADSASGSDAGASGRWESTVNGVLVRIAAVAGGYKTNLTNDAMLVDFGIAIKESLLAVARLQQRQLLERAERAKTIEVQEMHNDEFVVENRENGNHYFVRPNHPEVNQRCECADCHHRASKCKHQIAVENFLKQRLQAVVSLDDLLDKPFDELTAKDWE